MQPPAKGRPPTRTGRGRAPARWTGWEIALITLSVLMIAFPLYAEMTRWIMPPLAPAQESTPSAEPTAEQTSAQPTNTDIPVTDLLATDAPTAQPAAADTAQPNRRRYGAA